MEDPKLTIVTVDEAQGLVADLFTRAFGEPPPTFPSHYVAFYQTAPSTFAVMGYYHVTYKEEYALVGGLCVDTRLYRTIARRRRPTGSTRTRGVAEMLVTAAFKDIGERKAFFACTGNSTSRGIISRVGFIDTGHEYLMVKWTKTLAEDEKERIIAEVAGLGLF